MMLKTTRLDIFLFILCFISTQEVYGNSTETSTDFTGHKLFNGISSDYAEYDDSLTKATSILWNQNQISSLASVKSTTTKNPTTAILNNTHTTTIDSTSYTDTGQTLLYQQSTGPANNIISLVNDNEISTNTLKSNNGTIQSMRKENTILFNGTTIVDLYILPSITYDYKETPGNLLIENGETLNSSYTKQDMVQINEMNSLVTLEPTTKKREMIQSEVKSSGGFTQGPITTNREMFPEETKSSDGIAFGISILIEDHNSTDNSKNVINSTSLDLDENYENISKSSIKLYNTTENPILVFMNEMDVSNSTENIISSNDLVKENVDNETYTDSIIKYISIKPNMTESYAENTTTNLIRSLQEDSNVSFMTKITNESNGATTVLQQYGTHIDPITTVYDMNYDKEYEYTVTSTATHMYITDVSTNHIDIGSNDSFVTTPKHNIPDNAFATTKSENISKSYTKRENYKFPIIDVTEAKYDSNTESPLNDSPAFIYDTNVSERFYTNNSKTNVDDKDKENITTDVYNAAKSVNTLKLNNSVIDQETSTAIDVNYYMEINTDDKNYSYKDLTAEVTSSSIRNLKSELLYSDNETSSNTFDSHDDTILTIMQTDSSIENNDTMVTGLQKSSAVTFTNTETPVDLLIQYSTTSAIPNTVQILAQGNEHMFTKELVAVQPVTIGGETFIEEAMSSDGLTFSKSTSNKIESFTITAENALNPSASHLDENLNIPIKSFSETSDKIETDTQIPTATDENNQNLEKSQYFADTKLNNTLYFHMNVIPEAVTDITHFTLKEDYNITKSNSFTIATDEVEAHIKYNNSEGHMDNTDGNGSTAIGSLDLNYLSVVDKATSKNEYIDYNKDTTNSGTQSSISNSHLSDSSFDYTTFTTMITVNGKNITENSIFTSGHTKENENNESYNDDLNNSLLKTTNIKEYDYIETNSTESFKINKKTESITNSDHDSFTTVLSVISNNSNTTSILLNDSTYNIHFTTPYNIDLNKENDNTVTSSTTNMYITDTITTDDEMMESNGMIDESKLEISFASFKHELNQNSSNLKENSSLDNISTNVIMYTKEEKLGLEYTTTNIDIIKEDHVNFINTSMKENKDKESKTVNELNLKSDEIISNYISATSNPTEDAFSIDSTVIPDKTDEHYSHKVINTTSEYSLSFQHQFTPQTITSTVRTIDDSENKTNTIVKLKDSTTESMMNSENFISDLHDTENKTMMKQNSSITSQVHQTTESSARNVTTISNLIDKVNTIPEQNSSISSLYPATESIQNNFLSINDSNKTGNTIQEQRNSLFNQLTSTLGVITTSVNPINDSDKTLSTVTINKVFNDTLNNASVIYAKHKYVDPTMGITEELLIDKTDTIDFTETYAINVSVEPTVTTHTAQYDDINSPFSIQAKTVPESISDEINQYNDTPSSVLYGTNDRYTGSNADVTSGTNGLILNNIATNNDVENNNETTVYEKPYMLSTFRKGDDSLKYTSTVLSVSSNTAENSAENYNFIRSDLELTTLYNKIKNNSTLTNHVRNINENEYNYSLLSSELPYEKMETNVLPDISNYSKNDLGSKIYTTIPINIALTEEYDSEIDAKEVYTTNKLQLLNVTFEAQSDIPVHNSTIFSNEILTSDSITTKTYNIISSDKHSNKVTLVSHTTELSNDKASTGSISKNPFIYKQSYASDINPTSMNPNLGSSDIIVETQSSIKELSEIINQQTSGTSTHENIVSGSNQIDTISENLPLTTSTQSNIPNSDHCITSNKSSCTTGVDGVTNCREESSTNCIKTLFCEMQNVSICRVTEEGRICDEIQSKSNCKSQEGNSINAVSICPACSSNPVPLWASMASFGLNVLLIVVTALALCKLRCCNGNKISNQGPTIPPAFMHLQVPGRPMSDRRSDHIYEDCYDIQLRARSDSTFVHVVRPGSSHESINSLYATKDIMIDHSQLT